MPNLFPDPTALLDRYVDDEIERAVEAMDLELNEYGYDRWGVSPRAIRRALVLLRWMYRRYNRVTTHGLENIPSGRVMLIGNHSSQMAYDGALTYAALALDADPPRHVHAMIERFFAYVPGVSVAMQRTGQLIGIPQNAERLLQEEEAAVLVFPEGARGGGKVFKDRYKIMGFGQGFMRLALKTNTPIVPFGFVGGEEMCPSFSKQETLSKLVGAPYTPLTPTILPLPLPTKCYIHFGAPMHFEGHGDEDDDVVRPMVGEVEEAVTDLIARGLDERTSIFFG